MIIQKVSMKFSYGMATLMVVIEKVSESLVRLVVIALWLAYLLWLLREMLVNQF